jgi:hypothetical protein
VPCPLQQRPRIDRLPQHDAAETNGRKYIRPLRTAWRQQHHDLGGLAGGERLTEKAFGEVWLSAWEQKEKVVRKRGTARIRRLLRPERAAHLFRDQSAAERLGS